MDTIVARATGEGKAGIGIIRISGPEALGILHRLFVSKKSPAENPRTLVAGFVRGSSGQVLDRALAVFMSGRHSATGEDVAEIHCHGSPPLLREVMALACEAGARPARAGEFTRRAFENGKLTLAQAEAVLLLIEASSSAEVRAAARALGSQVERRIRRLSEAISDRIAEIGAYVEFPDEPDVNAFRPGLLDLEEAISSLRSSLRSIRPEGWKVVVAGAANVGKSSLVNAIAKKRVSIVTSMPGTTRDAVGADIEISGERVRLVDTAGIGCESRCEADCEAQKVSLDEIESASIVLWVEDEREETRDRPCISAPTIGVRNKADLIEESLLPGHCEKMAKEGIILVSARTGFGISRLLEALAEVIRKERGPDCGIAASDRVIFAVESARDAVRRASRRLDELPEISVLELERARDELASVLGIGTGKDILDRVFEKFCIGK
jgi:tRNA modification GTPase